MPLLKGICSNCGGVLDVDSNGKFAICPYCGTSFIVEDAVEEYNIHQENYIHNSVVHFHGNLNMNAEEYFEKGKSFLVVNESKKAIKKFKEALRIDNNNDKYQFFISMLEKGGFYGQEGELYVKRHPQIEEYERELLNLCKTGCCYIGDYFISFFDEHQGVGYGGIVDKKRCEYFCDVNGGIPEYWPHYGSVYHSDLVNNGYMINEKNGYSYRSSEQIEFLFKNDKKNLVSPYKKRYVQCYEGADCYISPYEYAKGVVLPVFAKAPKHGKNLRVAQLMEKYYTKPKELIWKESGKCKYCGGEIGILGKCGICKRKRGA